LSPKTPLLIDRFGRPVDGLRISITDACNFACIYCHREGVRPGAGPAGQERLMSPEELGRIARVAAELGIVKVKLTGGEPTLRPDVVDVVAEIAAAPGLVDLSMTTNGSRLADLAYELAEAGLMRVNVSLDTLDPAKFKFITGRDCLPEVLAGIEAALDAGLRPLKLNMVLLRGLNDHEVWRMVEFAREKGAILQVIELVRAPGVPERFYAAYHADLAGLEAELARRAERVIRRELQDRPKFFLPDGAEVELVRPVHNSRFCAKCRRLRLTADGRLKLCLMRPDALDLLGPLRAGVSDEELKAIFKRAVELREPFYKADAIGQS